MAKTLPVPSNTARKVLVTQRTAGMFTRGTAKDRPGKTYDTLPGYDWHGDSARAFPGQKYLDDQADKAMAAGYGRRNRKCPECGILSSNTGGCFC